MKKTSVLLLGVFGCLAVGLVGCGDKVADPEALYQKYLKDDAAREEKLKECKLLSTDEFMKSQTCEIARKAAAQKGTEDFGRALKDFGNKAGK